MNPLYCILLLRFGIHVYDHNLYLWHKQIGVCFLISIYYDVINYYIYFIYIPTCQNLFIENMSYTYLARICSIFIQNGWLLYFYNEFSYPLAKIFMRWKFDCAWFFRGIWNIPCESLIHRCALLLADMYIQLHRINIRQSFYFN